jgi:ATP-binding protein involved in chromosome partitioning
MPASPLTEDQVRAALREVKFPGFSRDIISFGLLKAVAVGAGNEVTVHLQVVTRDPSVPPQIERDARAALARLPGIGPVRMEVAAQQPAVSPPVSGTAASGTPARPHIPGVKHVVAVASGKGGVGKSTVAVNLACALSQAQMRVGLMDADIYGPSIPKMMGTHDQPTVTGERLDPVEAFGLKMMSMAFLLEADAPVIWRGPMIMKAIQQFTLAVNWGELDILVVDLPPGTGDAQLSLVQTIALDGGVIVTTPQDVALDVARRGIAMFEKVNVPILGIIENMSYYICPHCHQHDDVFGHGGARQEASRLDVPFLGEIPLFTEIRVCGDKGQPIVLAAPESVPATAFRALAATLRDGLRTPAQVFR